MSKFSVSELMKLVGCSTTDESAYFVALVDREKAHPREHRYVAQVTDMMIDTDHAREVVAAYISWKIESMRMAS